MAEYDPNVVSVSSTGPKLPDGVVDIESIETSDPGPGAVCSRTTTGQPIN